VSEPAPTAIGRLAQFAQNNQNLIDVLTGKFPGTGTQPIKVHVYLDGKDLTHSVR
jgi:hypothetical protein